MPDGNWESRYKSPINIETICEKTMEKINNDTLRYVYDITCKYAIAVDKEELLKALHYDRNQFKEGYLKGREDERADIVRCKDCKHNSKLTKDSQFVGWCYKWQTHVLEYEDYCSKAERMKEE